MSLIVPLFDTDANRNAHTIHKYFIYSNFYICKPASDKRGFFVPRDEVIFFYFEKNICTPERVLLNSVR